MTFHPRALTVASAILTASFALDALGDATAEQKAAAEMLFDQGRRLMDDKDYASACARFEQSQRLDEGIGTLLYLADCYEKNGQLASAWGTFREAASRARAASQAERERIANERARELAASLPTLTVEVVAKRRPPGLELTRDGHAVDSALFGVAVPLDPGSHTLRAVAPGKTPWVRVVEAEAGKSAVVSVPVLEEAPALTATRPSDERRAEPVRAAVATTSEPPARPRGQRILGVSLGAAGVVGLAVAAAFGVAAKSANDQAREHCQRPGGLCDPQGVAAGGDFESRARAANLAAGIGAAVLVAGGVVFFTAPSERAPSGFAMSPSSDLRGAALAWEGSW